MMKTVCIVFTVWFTMENLCASAHTHARTTQSGCRSDQFLCSIRGGCIPALYRCDGEEDCVDGTDEYGCNTSPSQFVCRSDEFKCSTGNRCVPARYQCDGDNDCLDNSDKSGCNSPTSTASTILTTRPSPTMPSSSSDSTWQHLTKSTSTSIPPVEISTTLNRAHLLNKLTEKYTTGSVQRTSASHVQTEKEYKEYGYLDRINTMVAVIVGGVVITAIVISVAVVLVLRKRRATVKIEEHYDMPNFNQSCQANNDKENVRNSNVYDFIPDSGDCCASNYTGLEYTTAKENDYLTPVTESKEAPAKESDYLTPVVENKEAPYNLTKL